VTVAGIVVLFLGLVVAGTGAGLALFERVEPRGTLRLMGLGTVVAVVGLLVTVLTADRGESLEAGTFVPLVIVVAIVAYAAWFARRAGSRD
jgi:Na+-translocating ferredoxin:NAD+ oxidoreductase RnfE subunit